MIIPAGLEIGGESTIAANRLILVDPRGEIDEKTLLKLLESKVEPEYWKWRSAKEGESSKEGGESED